jgi:D-tyrosyl-tRNA(Tyr) deacylase
MKIVLQRVSEASVCVGRKTVGRIGRGLCLLVGVEKGDTEDTADHMAQKIGELRIFSDPDGKMNLSLLDIGGGVLAVSQFTLAGSIRKGRRPSFDRAEAPEAAAALFDYFVERLRGKGMEVETGVFGAKMDVRLVNEGPVTFFLSRDP